MKEIAMLLLNGLILFVIMFFILAHADLPSLSPQIFQAGPGLFFTESGEYSDSFETSYTLTESWPMEESKNKNWWVNSGAYFYSEGGIGRTVQGRLSLKNEWTKQYGRTNPRDTQNGTRPQNIFRLILRKQAEDVVQTVYAQTSFYDQSMSEYRGTSNGILLFSRYVDSNNLYYAGIRVDGNVVIKKKLNGKYFTLAMQKIFPGNYDRISNANLIPLHTWFGLKSEVVTQGNMVRIRFYTDFEQTGNWTLALEVVDDGITYGPAITEPGYGGIRTDFMDVAFKEYTFRSYWP